MIVISKIEEKLWLNLAVLGLILAVLVSLVSVAKAADEENCLLCHRYSGCGTYEKTGVQRVFYINEELYAKSVHGTVKCSNCHYDVKEIPHKPAKKVDCALKCHVKEPSTEKAFSHEIVTNEFNKSIHVTGIKAGYEEDMPNCVYCHQNPIYAPIRNILSGEAGIELSILLRCRACHEDKVWTDRYYRHFTHRMHRRMSNRDLVELCSSCHEDAERMARYGLEPTGAFKDTYHWKAVKYELENAPNCVSCHSPLVAGHSVHGITKLSDPDSPLSGEAKLKTCQGAGDCHPAASESFIRGKVHSAGLKIDILRKKGDEGEIVTSTEERKIAYEREQIERLKIKVVGYIKLFYKTMIILVGGFMFLHQLLDLRVTIRDRRREGHR